ncbi:MAG: cell division protein ZapA [Bacilli bacterium]
MTEGQNRVKVDIFGQVYTLRGPASPERLIRLAALVDEKMNALFAQNPRLDLQTLAVLTALNMAQEYDEIAREYETLLEALEEEARS